MDLIRRISRKKYYANSSNELHTNRLSKSMEIFDLAAMGTGAGLGYGVFILAGHVAHYQAGPAVSLSILCAILVAIFAGLCYSELSSRISRVGSSYVYSYILIGELIAFLIAWTIILECIIGAAGMLKGISMFLNGITGQVMELTFMDVAPMVGGTVFADYFDFFTFGFGILLAIVFAFGLKRSILVANLSFIVTLCTVIYLIITGIFKADAKNWRIPEEIGNGKGGFFPYGSGGIFSGTATFMFVFIGFESVLSFRTMGKNVQRFTNVSFFVKLLVLLCGIMGVGMILTFMFPYHNTNIVNMPRIFEDFEWYATQWTIAITGIICLTVCIFETIYLLKNLLVVMADDSLLLQSVKVSSTILRTPDFILFWTIFLIGLASSLFQLRLLIDMLSIGVLAAFVMVSACVTIIRYSDYDSRYLQNSIDIKSNIFMDLFNGHRIEAPSKTSIRIVKVITFIYCLTSLGLSILIQTSWQELLDFVVWAVVLLGVFLFVMIFCLVIIVLQPKYDVYLNFKVPFVPLLPAISMFVNIYLIVCLDMSAWIRFAVWTVIGLGIYLAIICLEKPILLPVKRDFPVDEKASESTELPNPNSTNSMVVTPENLDENGNVIVKPLPKFCIEQLEESQFKSDQHTVDTPIENEVLQKVSNDYVTEYLEYHEKPLARYSEENLILPPPDYNDDYEIIVIPKALPDPESEPTKTPMSPLTEEKERETRIALDILDDILNVEDPAQSPEMEARNLPLANVLDEPPTSNSTAQLVVAVVHRNNEESEKNEPTEDNVSLTESYTVVLRAEEESRGPLLSITEFLTQEKDLSPELKDEPVMTYAEFLNESVSVEKPTEPDVQLTESPIVEPKSEERPVPFTSQLNSIINKKANVYKFDEIVGKRATEPTEAKKLRNSRSEPDLVKYLAKTPSGVKLERQNSETPIKENVSIPEPPKFDPILYKSVGIRAKSKRESIQTMSGVPATTTESSKVDEETAPIIRSLRKVPQPLKLAPVEIEDEQQPLGIVGIKNKLEEIFKRGPQNIYHPRPRSMALPPAQPTPTSPTSKTERSSTPTESIKAAIQEGDTDSNSSSVRSSIRKSNAAIRPWDTVSKQKLLFKDVLKAINPDTKPSDVKHTPPH